MPLPSQKRRLRSIGRASAWSFTILVSLLWVQSVLIAVWGTHRLPDDSKLSIASGRGAIRIEHRAVTGLPGLPPPGYVKTWQAQGDMRMNILSGFHAEHVENARLTSGGTLSMRSLTVPYWFLWLLAAGPLIAGHLVKSVQSRSSAARHSAGLCPLCGYDLRATPGRCPECGSGQNEALPAA